MRIATASVSTGFAMTVRGGFMLKLATLPFQGRLFYSFTCNSRMGLFCRMEAEMAALAPTQRAKWAIT